MKPEITLIHDVDCPNAAAARALLREALVRLGLEPEWIEQDRSVPGYGSPTILVDGTDVAGETGDASAPSCRVYSGEHGLRGVPSIEAIVAAITRSRAARGAKEPRR
jgi:hypothetical protein